MQEITNVVIGIQARSTSKRFPRKIFARLGDKPILARVIDAVFKCATYLNRQTFRSKLFISVAVVTPTGDNEVIQYCTQKKMTVIEGPEHDVLTRYKNLLDASNADYIVRITSDCPLIPPPFITKAIKVAVMNKCDYCSNVDPRFRTSPDGFDVEVVSRRALEWAHANATESYDREHVTSILRGATIPNDFRVGVIIGYIDESSIKISVDTPEDLAKVQEQSKKLTEMISLSEKIYGEKSVHRF